MLKELTDFGIDEQDGLEGSERAYPGPEVSPLHLVLAKTLLARDRT